MANLPNRRQFLGLTGASAVASFAGCADLNPMSAEDDPHADLITAVVEPDAEALRELEEAVFAGEIDQATAMQELEALSAEASSAFEDHAADQGALTIEASETLESGLGLFLVDGSPDALIDALKGGDVSQLHPGPTYETVLERQAQQQQQGPPEGIEPNDEALEEADDERSDETDDEGADGEGADDEGVDDEGADDEGVDDEGSDTEGADDDE